MIARKDTALSLPMYARTVYVYPSISAISMESQAIPGAISWIITGIAPEKHKGDGICSTPPMLFLYLIR